MQYIAEISGTKYRLKIDLFSIGELQTDPSGVLALLGGLCSRCHWMSRGA